jgi:hypothetical protein
MYYGNGRTNFPRLENYKQALEHHDSIKPIRGRAVECRPLLTCAGGRARSHYAIKKGVINGVDCVSVILYVTPVITYLADGEIWLEDGGYPTNTTHQVMCMVLGRGHAFAVGGRSILALGENGHDKYFAFPEDAPLRLTVTGTQVTVLNPTPMYREYVLRGKMGEVRKRRAKPITYIRNMAKLMEAKEVDRRSSFSSQGRARELLESSDIADWYEMAKHVYALAVQQTWEYGQGYVYKLTRKGIDTQIAKILRTCYADCVTELRPLPFTTCPKSGDTPRN